MDIKRTILIVALAVVSYVMVLKWNQDYGQAALPTQNVAASTTAPALPDTVSGNNASNSADVPSANTD
ncbi:MAG: membrane protein insertase YidC, partial [Pseudomonas bubulae]